jgi:hypothetical protein
MAHLHNLVAGGCAGLATIVIQPLDVMKTRLECAGLLSQNKSLSVLVLRNVVTDVFNTRGLAGFWSGGMSTLLFSVPSASLYFTSIAWFRQSKHFDTHSFEGNVLAGAISRLIATSLPFPAIVLKTRFESGVFPVNGGPFHVRAISSSCACSFSHNF